MPPLQTVVPGGLSAVSPSTEAFFSVLKADWNPSDSRASSSVLVMIEDDQFSVLYEDVFLFKRVSDRREWQKLRCLAKLLRNSFFRASAASVS